jgi:threonine/homoserine/homoserine lactone efflux protein
MNAFQTVFSFKIWTQARFSMIPPDKLALFIISSLALLIVPGPAVLYIVTRSLSQGRAAGLVSMAGVNAGALTHTVAAALGLSAILVSSALAFNVVKYVGAAYLIFIGVQQFLSRKGALETAEVKQDSLGRIFTQGYVVSIFNPKLALFFFAFLPQFVDPNHGAVTAQMLFLGLTFVVLAALSDGAWALLSSSLGRWLKRNPRFASRQKYVSGSVYVGLGVTAALTGNHK